MRFSELAEALEKLEGISSGNEMRKELAWLFKKTPSSEIKSVSYLVLGLIDSEFKGVITGMAGKMAIRSLSLASKVEVQKIKSEYKRKGDLGLVAEQVLKGGKQTTLRSYFKLKRKALTPNDVIQGLKSIAGFSGAGSQEKKIKTLAALFQYCSPLEAKYLTRITLGTLRIGVGAMTVLDGLSIAFTGSKKAKPALEEAYNQCNDIGLVADAFAHKRLKGLEKISFAVGTPIKMMLAQRVKHLADIAAKIPGKITAEEKYDGERFQAHKTAPGKVIIFSRRLEDISAQYPDVKGLIEKNVKGKSFIVEGEIVPVDKKGRILEFQRLMQRRRKYKVEEYIEKIPVEAYLFDCLYLNGKDLTKSPYPERRKALAKMTREKANKIELAKQIVTDDIKKIDQFFHKALARGTEGLVCKSNAKDSIYRAGARAWLWIKWKKDYIKGFRDTFDLVVVGAFAGRGLRAGTFGALLCAAYNKQKDSFETFCRLGSGFTKKELKALPKKLAKYRSKEKPARVDSKVKADVWYKPGFVVEVTGGEITKSPMHIAAGGLALRFPRLTRYRPDKSAEQATSAREIKQMYGKKKGK